MNIILTVTAKRLDELYYQVLNFAPNDRLYCI